MKHTHLMEVQLGQSLYDVYKAAKNLLENDASCIEVRVLFRGFLLTLNGNMTYGMFAELYEICAQNRRKQLMSNPTANNQFSLERAKAGDAIETVEGHERRFIAYLPDRRERMRVVVLDPKADKLYSHHEDGRHCELVQSLALRMRPKARRKMKRYVVTFRGDTPPIYTVSMPYENESDAKLYAEVVEDGQVHEITVKVDN